MLHFRPGKQMGVQVRRCSLSTCNRTGFSFPGECTAGWHTGLQTQYEPPCLLGSAVDQRKATDRSGAVAACGAVAGAVVGRMESVGTERPVCTSIVGLTGFQHGVQIGCTEGAGVGPSRDMRGGIGWRRAPGVYLGRRFCWLSTRGATWVHRGRWCRAESRKSSLCASNVLSQAVCVSSLCASNVLSQAVCVSSLCASNVLSQAVCVSSLCASNVLSQANRDGGRIRTRRLVPDRLFRWQLTRRATEEQRTRCCRAESR